MSLFMIGASPISAIYRGAKQVWYWLTALAPRFWSSDFAPTSLRLFQDAAGTILAYEAGQPIGKVARAAGTVDASQATALSRPTLSRYPKGGRRNLLTWTEQFDNSAWIKENVTVALDERAGAGAWRVNVPNDGSDLPRRVAQQANTGIIPWATVEVKKGNTRYVIIGTGSVRYRKGNFDLDAGEFVYTQSEVEAPKVEILPDGWFRISYKSDENTNPYDDWSFGFSDTVSGWTAVGSGSKFGFIRRPQVEATDVTAYQKVVSQYDVTEAGVPDVWHLFNDGGDSLLALLPNGSYEVATVGIDGKPHYASVTGDNSGKNILLGSDRIADIFVRAGTLPDAVRLRLEEYWQQWLGAGYLVPPGMVPGARQMWETSSAGAAVVSAGQPVGAMLVDSSVVKGPSLNPASAWTSNPSGAWQINAATGVATIAAQAAAGNYDLRATGANNIPDTAGKWLWVEFDYEVTGGHMIWYPFSPAPAATLTGSGRISQPVFATVATHLFRVTAGIAAKVSNWSVREITGQFASQATALSRPTLVRHPRGGRRNLLTWTADPSNPVWTKTNAGDYTMGYPDPFGGNQAIRWKPVFATDPGGSNRSADLRQAAPGAVTKMRYSIYVKRVKVVSRYPSPPDGGEADRDVFMRLRNELNGTLAINLRTLEVIESASNYVSSGVQDVGGGWLRIWFTGQGAVAGNGNTWVTFGNRINQSNFNFDPYPDGTEEVHLYGVMLELGDHIDLSEPPGPPQIVTTAFDIRQPGSPDIWHLWNDGGDSLPAILPAGAWEIAWVTHLGAVSYASVTSDGSTGTNLLRAERMADVALKRGRFTSYEKAQIEAQWEKYKP